ncbi:MAG: hypothetical protein N3A38_10445 [Planctomycetota bacterium]|nr:hypothetical protein [Planctomycetota bacterium]
MAVGEEGVLEAMSAPWWLREILNFASRPPLVLGFLAALVFAAVFFRRRLTRPIPTIFVAAASAAIFALCLSDGTFRGKALDADNAVVFLLLSLTAVVLWTAIREAAINDRGPTAAPPGEAAGERSGESGDGAAGGPAGGGIATGESTPGTPPAAVPGMGYPPPAESADGPGAGAGATPDIKVTTWPHLLYIELIAAVFATVALAAWAMIADAPLEAPADPGRSPNPAKAPWYFAGIQEMLAYFDPWLGGAFIPALIVLGLAAIPYLDPDPSGAGMYTFRRRPAAVAAFLFGFVALWIGLIMVGTFVRGPDWDAYGIFEPWGGARLECPAERPLSDAFWEGLLGRELPAWPPARELPGILLLIAYFAVPPLLAARVAPDVRRRMGAARFWMAAFLILAMLGIPAVICFRWLFGIRHIVSIPEVPFNI